MMPPGYFDAFTDTEIELGTIHGLVVALDDIISRSDALSSDHYDQPAIFALLSVLREKSKAIHDLHHLEWDPIAGASSGTSNAPAAGVDGAQASCGGARAPAGDHARLEPQPAG
ncbi:hypothetical protein [Pararhodobacter aggregans]|uniref:hypothetical protein n=1 Tax=Pararhodobacter aggregans TaxID=404875 RepID=UPI003A93D659